MSDVNARSLLDKPMQVRLTVDDFITLHNAGAFKAYARTELIEGAVVAVNAQFSPHALVAFELAYRLRWALEQLGSDLRIFMEGSVSLGNFNVPMPDISIVAPFEMKHAPAPGAAMRLAVEVSVTTLSYDLKKKLPIYAREGVPEYWVVDVKNKLVHCHNEPFGATYRQVDKIAFGQPLASLTIPALSIETNRLA